MNKSMLVIICTILLSACSSTLSSKAAMVREADSKMVSNCQFLGTVFGNSMLGIALANKSGNNAIAGAKEKAAKLGATHIVISSMKAADWNGGSQATAKAYKCK